jgi:uncharacterized protein (TIGR03437 family)
MLRLCVLAIAVSAAAWGSGFFGKVVAIGGHASDIALDEGRGVLYIADYTANRVEVMNLSDQSISTSINVAFPGSLALSRDGRYLVVTTYANFDPKLGQPTNIVTIINLETNTRRTVSTSTPPLSVQFGADGFALVLTTTEFLLLDPATAVTVSLDTIAAVLAKTLPVTAPTFPPQILTASMGVSGDGQVIYGITDTILFKYTVRDQGLTVLNYSSTPPLGPRLMSVNQDGTLYVAGWSVSSAKQGYLGYEFFDVSGALNIGSHAVDSARGLIYAQIPDSGPPPPPPSAQTACFPDGRCVTETILPPAGTAPPVLGTPPNLMIVDADNLALRQRFLIQENLGGRSILSSDGATLYSISDSGVTIFPIGSIAQVPQLLAGQEDVVFLGAFCDRRTLTQTITITDGGAHTDFRLSVDDPALAKAVTFSATSGTTPATIRVTIDTTQFQNQNGTTVGFIRLESNQAANLQPLTCPTPASLSSWPAGCIRLLINNREPDQRGTIVNVPGRLVDLLADPARNRFYIIRQDKNQVLVFDGATNAQIGTLRTNNNPTQMAILGDPSSDSKYLLVGHSDAKSISVFDLDTLQESDPILMPRYLYPRSVAVSAGAILASSRSAAGDNLISQVDFDSRTATPFPTLGAFKNSVNEDTILVSAPHGNYVMAAMPDGTVLLYDSSAGTFTVSRKDFTALSGAYAASDSGQFAIDNKLLNQSLARVAELDRGQGGTSGFAFLGDSVLRTTGPVSSGPATGSNVVGAPGIIERVSLANPAVVLSTRTVEAPRFPTSTAAGGTVASGGATSAASQFIRSLVALPNGNIISLTQSGFVTLSSNFDATTVKPIVTSVVNTSDPSQALTGGGLISVLGTNFSTSNASSNANPAVTVLADSCVTVNGGLIPLFLVTPTKINAQLPLTVGANGILVVHTPGGDSDPFNLTTQSTAPSIFEIPPGTGSGGIGGSGGGGPLGDTIPAVFRVTDAGLLQVTLVNPIHKGDRLVIFASGLGATTPPVDAGFPAPSNPRALVNIQPVVTLDGANCPVTFAGLVGGQIGIYEIDVNVPQGIQQGLTIPLTISQGSNSSTVFVRVVQ